MTLTFHYSIKRNKNKHNAQIKSVFNMSHATVINYCQIYQLFSYHHQPGQESYG